MAGKGNAACLYMRGKVGARSRLGKGEVTSSKQWILEVMQGSGRVQVKVAKQASKWLKYEGIKRRAVNNLGPFLCGKLKKKTA